MTETSNDSNNDSNGALAAIEESVGTHLLRALYEEITNLRTVWVVTPQQQQQEILDRLQDAVSHAVSIAVRRLATGGFENIVAQIDSLTIKDEAKAVLMLPRGTQELHTLADRVGSKAIIVFADAKEYTDGMHVISAQDDQPSLPLE